MEDYVHLIRYYLAFARESVLLVDLLVDPRTLDELKFDQE